MSQLNTLTKILGGIRAHRRLIAIWFGSLSALATVLAVGAFATGGNTLDAGSATPPPHPLDYSHPCTWYVVPKIDAAARTALEVGPPPTPSRQEEVANKGAEQTVEEAVDQAIDRANQATVDQRERLVDIVTQGSGSTQPRQAQPPKLPMHPTDNPDPIVNAPSPARQGSH